MLSTGLENVSRDSEVFRLNRCGGEYWILPALTCMCTYSYRITVSVCNYTNTLPAHNKSLGCPRKSFQAERHHTRQKSEYQCWRRRTPASSCFEPWYLSTCRQVRCQFVIRDKKKSEASFSFQDSSISQANSWPGWFGLAADVVHSTGQKRQKTTFPRLGIDKPILSARANRRWRSFDLASSYQGTWRWWRKLSNTRHWASGCGVGAP